MTFIAQYGFFFAMLIIIGAIIFFSYLLPKTERFVHVLTALLVLGGIGIIIYSFLGPDDPFTGIALAVLAFFIWLGTGLGWIGIFIHQAMQERKSY
ncbi:hypothetical protein SAMN05421781_0829 [Marinococcus luteus]|uniref:YesK-like protein n=1 Tax=Marinococcus luteus TaxID=1122204 RepID=A0A1H2RM61_9BACI|nr:hypothetical protein [Marinococcus luteus]SDW20250.1 hypothetical protein SAMN05421781_0829 [Marinococcus luteus]